MEGGHNYRRGGNIRRRNVSRNRDLVSGETVVSAAFHLELGGCCLLFDGNRLGKWAIPDNEGAKPLTGCR